MSVCPYRSLGISAGDFISTRGVKSETHLPGMYVGLTGIAMGPGKSGHPITK